MPTAWWRTSTCPGPGWGVGTSSSFSTDGPPYSETRIAFMRVSSSGRGGIGSSHPERRGLADRLQIDAALGRATRVPDGQIVGVQHVTPALGTEEAGHVAEVASNPHWANQRCAPPTEIRYWVGKLLSGGNDAM